MTAVLALDLGKTGCRALLWTGQAEVPRVHEVPGAPGLAEESGVALAVSAVLAAARTLLTREDDGVGALPDEQPAGRNKEPREAGDALDGQRTQGDEEPERAESPEAARIPAGTESPEPAESPKGTESPEPAERSENSEGAAWAGTVPGERLTAVCVGAAGAAAAPEAARELAGLLLAALPTDEVAVTSDAVTAHAGALGGGTGVVLAAGTGAVAVGIGQDGTFARVDGWGPWLGDEGSGAWIGRAGLRAALRAHDGRGPATALTAAATEMFGDLDRLPRTVGGEKNPARVMAAFAPVVARAAADTTSTEPDATTGSGAPEPTERTAEATPHTATNAGATVTLLPTKARATVMPLPTEARATVTPLPTAAPHPPRSTPAPAEGAPKNIDGGPDTSNNPKTTDSSAKSASNTAQTTDNSPKNTSNTPQTTHNSPKNSGSDPVAAGIMREAAVALAEAVIAAARRIGTDQPLPVTVTGGLAGLGAPLLRPLDALLAASGLPLRSRAPLGDPLEGARLLALRSSGPHEPSVIRVRRATAAGGPTAGPPLRGERDPQNR